MPKAGGQNPASLWPPRLLLQRQESEREKETKVTQSASWPDLLFQPGKGGRLPGFRRFPRNSDKSKTPPPPSRPTAGTHLPGRRGRGLQRRDVTVDFRLAAPHHDGSRARPRGHCPLFRPLPPEKRGGGKGGARAKPEPVLGRDLSNSGDAATCDDSRGAKRYCCVNSRATEITHGKAAP